MGVVSSAARLLLSRQAHHVVCNATNCRRTISHHGSSQDGTEQGCVKEGTSTPASPDLYDYPTGHDRGRNWCRRASNSFIQVSKCDRERTKSQKIHSLNCRWRRLHFNCPTLVTLGRGLRALRRVDLTRHSVTVCSFPPWILSWVLPGMIISLHNKVVPPRRVRRRRDQCGTAL